MTIWRTIVDSLKTGFEPALSGAWDGGAGTAERRRQRGVRSVQQQLEDELDSVYHSLDLTNDFGTGMVRGLAIGLAAVRGSSLPTEIQRSLGRLEQLEQRDEAPWQLKLREPAVIDNGPPLIPGIDVTLGPRGPYRPLYAEKRCAVCGYWRGQHHGDPRQDSTWHCPVDASWFGVTATFMPQPT